MSIDIADIKNFDPKAYLERVGGLGDSKIHLAHTALALAALSCEGGHKGVRLERYVRHLDKLVEDVAVVHARILKAGAADGAQSQLEALSGVLCDMHDYTGDQARYDDLENASLLRVIDRARGLPIMLSILYIHAGRAQGWDVQGLNIPGHFLCAVQREGQRILFDPFMDCAIVEAHDLRRLIKRGVGEEAEISAEYYKPANNRDILIRLQNNIKYRQIDAEDYTGALVSVQYMRLIAPDEYRLLLDLGVLYARVEQPRAAVESLAGYIERAPHSRDRADAEMLLQQIHEQIH